VNNECTTSEQQVSTNREIYKKIKNKKKNNKKKKHSVFSTENTSFDLERYKKSSLFND
jgi:hypothetical protein